MNKCILASVGVCVVLAGPVSAADVPVFKAPIATSSFSWTGLYFGLHAGGAWNTADWFYPSTALNAVAGAPVSAPFNVSGGNHSAFGGIAGGQIGYNHQIGNWVLGAEAEFSWTRLNGSNVDPVFPNINHSQTDFLATMGGRVGYAWDRFMLFGKAGGGWAHSKYFTTAATTFNVGDPGTPPSTINAGSLENTATMNRFGLMLGAGAEYALTSNWSIKAEYEYLDFGRQHVTLSPAEAGLAPFNEAIRQQFHLMKVGVNYKLDHSPNPSMSSYARSGRPEPASRFYAGAEYLLWSVKGAPLSVPLVSSGPESNKEGFLVNSDTSILYGAPFSPASGGNDTQNFPLFSGSRVTLGYWLDDAHRLAIEGRGFFLQSRSAGFSASGDATTGQPAMRIPVYNNVPYAPGGACDPDNPMACVISRTEDGVPISIPDDLYGSVRITNTLRLWGADGTVVLPSSRWGNWVVSPLLGVRYLNLSESLHLTANLVGLASSDLYGGQSGTATDEFATRNQFFGAVLGLRGLSSWGPWSLEMSGRIALGVSHEVLTVAGYYQDSGAAFANTSGPYGIFAMPANSGTFTHNEFAVVPEAQIKVGYNLTPSIRITVGYDFLYDSNVIRPGDQINRNIPKGQTFQQDGTPASTTSPASLFKTTDFYAHGLNLGVTARF